MTSPINVQAYNAIFMAVSSVTCVSHECDGNARDATRRDHGVTEYEHFNYDNNVADHLNGRRI